MALSNDIKERIFAAADRLHAASEAGEFPNVEAVRQESRAGMNNVVEAMKEWRQNLRKQVQAVREPLPVELHSVVQSMGQSLWETAQQLANESLDAAKVAFETEKSDLIQLSAEQSEAFETQAVELEKTETRVAELARELAAAKTQIEAAGNVITEIRDDLRVAQQKAELAGQKAEETERRAKELGEMLDRAHADADRLRQENIEARQQAAVEMEAVRVELVKAQAKVEAVEKAHNEQRQQVATEAHRAAERMAKAQTERDDAIKVAAEARENAAGLAGQLQAVQEQNAAFLAVIKLPQVEAKAKKTPPVKS